MKIRLISAAMLSAFCLNAYSADPKLNSEKQQFSYAIGFQIGQSLKQDQLELDPDALALAIKDVLSGGTLRLSLEEMKAAVDAFQQKQVKAQREIAEKNEKAGAAFLAANKKKSGVKELPSGLQYKILREGDGPMPKATDTVEVNYRGTLINGEEFDSSYRRGQPTSFTVNGVIPGWTEALQLMKKGAKWQLFIPSKLAYGPRGAGGAIGPNETLIFEVELLDIK